MVIGDDRAVNCHAWCSEVCCYYMGTLGKELALSKMMAASAWNTLRERTYPDAPLKKGTRRPSIGA